MSDRERRKKNDRAKKRRVKIKSKSYTVKTTARAVQPGQLIRNGTGLIQTKKAA
jgi:hypothetical protein